MRRIVLVLLSVAALVGTPAVADPPGATDGVLCYSADVRDDDAGDDTYEGVLGGGPVVIRREDGMLESGMLVCRLQVGVRNHDGSGPEVSAFGPGVFSGAPSSITYSTKDNDPTDGDPVYLCSEFQLDFFTKYYWDSAARRWSTNSSVPCLKAFGSYDPNAEPSPTQVFLDSILCPILAIVFPPEGDIVLPVIGTIWDCPPYGNAGYRPALAHVAVEYNLPLL